MSKKKVYFLITIISILVIFILVSIILGVNDGYSGKRNLNENEKSIISNFLYEYYDSNNREEYVIKKELNIKNFFIPQATETVISWKILDNSFFVRHIFDNPIENQYVINVNVLYENQECEIEETFHLIYEDEKLKILWLYP